MTDRWTCWQRGCKARPIAKLGTAAFLLFACLVAGRVAIAQPAGPEILRGSVAPPPPVIEPTAGPERQRFAAGERLWIVDEMTSTVTGCRIVNTVRVGIDAIDCATRHLPGHIRGRQ